MGTMKVRRSGFTLIELLAVVGVIGVLVVIVLPAVQFVREASRRTACCNNLKQLSLATLNFESAIGRFPPGTIGCPNAVQWDDFRNQPTSDFYWKKYQHTSFLVLLLPYLEQNNEYGQVEPMMLDLKRRLGDLQAVNWFGEATGFMGIASTRIPLMACPSDSVATLGNQIKYIGGSQPVILEEDRSDYFSYVAYLSDISKADFVAVNYAGCSGAASGGDQHPDPERDKYRGVMSSGEVVRMDSVFDGLSNTVMLGECLGEIENDERLQAQPWIIGGLIRGRGARPWRSGVSLISMFGDLNRSSKFGFGSAHADIVNIAYADGSIKSVDRYIDWPSFYDLTGRADGNLFQSE